MSTNVGAGCGCHPTSEQSSLFSSSLSTCLARPVGGFSGLEIDEALTQDLAKVFLRPSS